MSQGRRKATLATLLGGTSNTLVVSLQAIVLMPLYLQYVGPRLYGAWLGSGDILVWMQAFDLGLPNLMIQRIGAAHGRKDTRVIAESFAAGALILGIVACLVAILGALISFYLPGWMGLSGSEAEELQQCFVVGAVGSAITIFSNSAVGLSRGIQATTFMNWVVLVSGIAGFGVSLTLILSGCGLWAIAFGLVTRAAVSLAGSLIFAVHVMRGEMLHFFRLRLKHIREFLTVSPVTALGGISYALMNQSESAIVAFFIRPELAAVLTITRKAADLIRALLDMVGYASYGGFAHLVSSDDRSRTLQVHAEISSLRLSLAIGFASAYMAVNSSLVSVWIGSNQYGGHLLTILMAFQIIIVGGSYLLNYLYRATGPVIKGSVFLIVEGIIRVPLMIALLLWFGLPGVPVAGIVTAGIFGFLSYRMTLKEVFEFSIPIDRIDNRVMIIRGAALAIGVLACVFVKVATWSYVIVMGAFLVTLGTGSLIYVDPLLSSTRASLNTLLLRLPLLKGSVRGGM